MSGRVKTRNYDDEGFVRRAACLCVNDDESQVLLVSSRRDSGLWIVPGGGLEGDEPPPQAALREVKEEAGVCGRLRRSLGVFENSERGHRTSVYVLVVSEELDEWHEALVYGRKRRWFSTEEAAKQLAKHKPLQSSYLQHLLLPSTATTTATVYRNPESTTIYHRAVSTPPTTGFNHCPESTTKRTSETTGTISNTSNMSSYNHREPTPTSSHSHSLVMSTHPTTTILYKHSSSTNTTSHNQLPQLPTTVVPFTTTLPTSTSGLPQSDEAMGRQQQQLQSPSSHNPGFSERRRIMGGVREKTGEQEIPVHPPLGNGWGQAT